MWDDSDSINFLSINQNQYVLNGHILMLDHKQNITRKGSNVSNCNSKTILKRTLDIVLKNIGQQHLLNRTKKNEQEKKKI